jgi:hypothetical protein
MASSPISGLPAATAGQATDLYVIVDTTDHSQAPTGTDKKLTGTQLINFVASVTSALTFVGNWNASTNTPTLTSSVGTNGSIYVVSVAGNTALDGIGSWAVGDWAVFDGVSNTWTKVLGSFTGALLAANNLSDVANAATSRTNLGLGNVAVENTGNTVIDVSGALEQNSPQHTITGNSYTYLSTDRGKTVIRNNSSTNMTDTLPQATGSFGNGWFVWLTNNDATGNITITPTTSTINGVATFTLTAGSTTRIVSDGTNYWALIGAAGGGGVTSFNTRTGAVTLTSGDVTGALTYTPLAPANNLSDVSNAATARTNLGLGTSAVDNTGNTVIAVSGALEQATPANAQALTSYAYLSTDRGKTVIRSNAAVTMTDTLSQATGNFGDGWFVWVKNSDASASVIITPTTSTINGGLTYTIPAGNTARISSDGTNYEAFISSSASGVASFNTRTGAVTLTSGDVTTALGYTPLVPSNNLSDLTNTTTARANLGLGTAAVLNTGNTVIAISGALEQASPANPQTGANYTFLNTDRGKTVVRSNSGSAMADGLPQATGTFTNGWFVWVYNSDAVANITITPTISTINGASTLVLNPGQMTRISSDGTNYEALISSSGSGVTSFNSRTGIVTLISGDVTSALGYTPLRPSNNLSDVSSASTARTNLGLGTAAVDNTGNTVVAVSGALEQASPNNTQTAASYAYVAADRGKTVIRANAGLSMTDTIPQATGTFGAGWFTWITNNDASASITITPTTSTINGSATYVLTAGHTARIVSDGTNYFASTLAAAGSGSGVTSFNTRTGAVTLTSADVTSALTYTPLAPANNLSDVANVATARTNLGLGTAAVTNTGNSVVAVSGALEQATPNDTQAGASYIYVTADRGKTIIRSNAGSAMTDTLPQATGSFGDGWFTWVRNNDATATITITPTTSTINGASTYVINPGVTARINSNGSNYFAFGAAASGSGSSSGVTSFNTRTGAVTLSLSDVTTAITANGAQFNTILGQSSLLSISSGQFNTSAGYLALNSATTGSNMCAFGYGALQAETTHGNSSAFGYKALNANAAASNSAFGYQSLLSNTSGTFNCAFGATASQANLTTSRTSAFGYQALLNNIQNDSTAFGYQALTLNTISGSGDPNTAVGSQALGVNTTGGGNTACGYYSLATNVTNTGCSALGTYALANSIANNNTAAGYSAGSNLTSGGDNSAFGFNSLYRNTTGAKNSVFGSQSTITAGTYSDICAFGFNALNANTASQNCAFGSQSLTGNTSGTQNCAFGYSALNLISTNGSSSAFGYNALVLATGGSNTAVGSTAGNAVSTGTNNVIIGDGTGASLTTQSNNTIVGHAATSGAFSGSIVLGSGATGAANNQLVIGSAGTAITTATTIGAAGGASSLPSTPLKYLRVNLNGTVVSIPCYNP